MKNAGERNLWLGAGVFEGMKSGAAWIAAILLGLLAACVGTSGTASGGPPASPPPTCLTTARDDNGTVAATFRSTIDAIRQLPGVADNPQLGAYSTGQEATVCYIDGEIPKGPPPGTSGSIPPSFDRAVLVVVGDQTYFISAGYRENLPIRAP